MNVVRTWALGFILVGALIGVWISIPLQAQQVPKGNEYPTANPLLQYGNAPGWYQSYHGQSASAHLAKQYVDAKKEEEKQDIRKKLTDLLGQEFDAHTQQQQKELDDLEKQIASLRALLKKRVEAKPAIVGRRLEQLIQEAEGLGWNAPTGSHRSTTIGQTGPTLSKPK